MAFDGDTVREAALGSRPCHPDASTLRLPADSQSRLVFGHDDDDTQETTPLPVIRFHARYPRPPTEKSIVWNVDDIVDWDSIEREERAEVDAAMAAGESATVDMAAPDVESEP